MCALYEPTANGVHKRLHILFDKLRKNPVPVFLPERSALPGMQYGLVTYPIVKLMLFIFLCGPYGKDHFDAEWISTALRDLEEGDGTTLWRTLVFFTDRIVCDSGIPAPLQPLPLYVPPEAQNAIQCGDGEEVLDTAQDLADRFEVLAEYSEFADVYSVRGACV